MHPGAFQRPALTATLAASDNASLQVLKLLKITKREIEFTNPLFHMIMVCSPSTLILQTLATKISPRPRLREVGCARNVGFQSASIPAMKITRSGDQAGGVGLGRSHLSSQMSLQPGKHLGFTFPRV